MNVYHTWKSRMLPKEKERFDSADLIVHYLIRPISIMLSIPFASCRIRPLLITKVSLIFAIAAFPFFALDHFWTGWVCIFIWNLLDFVDGNVARCNNETSKQGALWDAAVGWIAMFSFYAGMGFAAFHHPTPQMVIDVIRPEYYLFLGAYTGFCMVFPRLVMHKKNELYLNTDPLQLREKYGLFERLGTSLISVNGCALLMAVILHILDLDGLFVAVYSVLLTLMCTVSLYSLLRERK